MAGISIEQAIDLGYATLQAFDKDDLEMTLKHPTYEVVNRWFGPDKRVLDGGDVVKAYISLKDTGNAQHVEMYDTDTPNVANVDKEITVNWTHAQTSFSYSLKELAMNLGNKRRVYNLLKQRRLNAYREFADLLEEAAWKTPASSTDTKSPHGLPAWIVQADADSASGDFVGYVGDYSTVNSAESAYADVGGIPCTSTTNQRWANWYADHDDQLNDALLKKMRRAFRKTHFQTPIIARQAIDPNSDFSNFRIYTNDEVLDALEEYALKSDDRVGSDLGKYSGAVTFKNIPIIYVDILDDVKKYVYGGNPIFGVNHNHFRAVILENENFRVNKPLTKVGQHNVFTVYVDLTYAYICDNRRAGGWLISDWEDGN